MMFQMPKSGQRALESRICVRKERDTLREYERQRYDSYHMSLKGLRENSVTFDENNFAIKILRENLKNTDKVRKHTFSAELRGFMIRADFDKFLGSFTGKVRDSVILFSFLSFTLAYIFAVFLSLDSNEKLEFYPTQRIYFLAPLRQKFQSLDHFEALKQAVPSKPFVNIAELLFRPVDLGKLLKF